ncbi:kinesin-like protein KIN-14C isoform X2 [Asparagus officinalis]|uniref:kinesin-like protein KIN-14C isoform X2 n=1 Tax=Asparagus officinalis TaxID=4686 RepID=UPI00098DE921|nr:kinesin-like protein KIN-14C isoform X2 [Asparagus officinalis]
MNLDLHCEKSMADYSHRMESVNAEADAAMKRSQLVEWLNKLFPDFLMPLDASEEELREEMSDGVVLCAILNGKNLASIESQRGVFISSEQRLYNVNRFLSAVDEMGLPRFNVSDLEQGSMSPVVDCLLSLRDMICGNGKDGLNDATKYGSQQRKKCDPKSPISGDEKSHGNPRNNDPKSPVSGDEMKRSISEPKLQNALRNSFMSESSAALLHPAGNKLHEVFQSKQGRFSDLPAAKISEMMKSNSLDNAPTQSLLGVVNGILDGSIERKNGEIPHRVACLLRKVIQEIERRISTQADHIRCQTNLIKAREEKYQSRIRVLETLASGTSEETQIVSNQLQKIKTEKTKVEESKKHGDQDMDKLMKEKEDSDTMISKLKQELETVKESYENRCQQLQRNSEEIKAKLEERIKEAESLLAESRKRTRELETFSESKFQKLNRKEHVFQNFIGSQLQSVKSMRVASESIKQEVIRTQKGWREEMTNFGVKLKVLVDAAENYHTIQAENRRLFNEVQELKGNIRVFCRIRPFLPGQKRKSTSVDYVGENGEVVVVNPSKQGKDGRRMFNFNKAFGPASTQEEVYSNIQPLVRSVLDGYNVCIFAYGQTGSGKTYTMSGPNSPTKEEWGVNYRALNDLFHISHSRKNTFLYEIGVQMVEIYNEQVRDLLTTNASQKRLGILSAPQSKGVAVPDASMLPVKSTSDVMELMEFGQSNRAMSSTAMNERSSRSHSIVTIHVEGKDLKTGSSSRGSLHLVDLAGSERVDRSEVTGDRLKEAQHINKSLSALGDVIFALAQKSSHVPYRNSKLTQVLQSSLGGHAKTLMFVQVNPDLASFSETVSTLKFAERVSGVELGAAQSNKEGKNVKDLMEQVASLTGKIAEKDEEIKELQLLKDLRAGNGSNSLRHSSSFSGSSLASRQQRLASGRVARSSERSASDTENFSEFSDRYSENSSQQSVDDLKYQKDMDSEERLSDISMGAETDSSTIESNSEAGKSSDATREKMARVPSRVPKPLLPRTGQTTSVRSKLKDPVKSPVLRKSTVSQTAKSPSSPTTKSSAKPLRR